ncbi:MAG: hypothetical protein AAFY71_25730 [Bacteroidota bacterium]
MYCTSIRLSAFFKLSFLHFIFSIAALSFAQTDFRLFQTEAFESSKGTLRYTELAIPTNLKNGSTAFVRIKFQNKDGEKATLGYREQAYRIEEAPTLINKSNVFNLTRIGVVKTIGEPGRMGLFDNLILEKGRRFMYQITLGLTDDVIYFHDNAVGERISIDLKYKGLESDQQSSKKKHPLLSLLNEEEEASDLPPAKKIRPAKQPIQQLENVDLDALKEKRNYQSFVLNTDEGANRHNHHIRVVYHVPEQIRVGSLIRVVAVKSTSDAREILAFLELDYYVKTIGQEGSDLVYFMEKLPDSIKVDGEPLQLTQLEMEALSEVNAISILLANGNKGLGIQHGAEGASLAIYVGMVKL